MLPVLSRRLLDRRAMLMGLFAVAVAVALAFLMPFSQDTAMGQSKPAAPSPFWAIPGLKKMDIYWLPPSGVVTGYEVRHKKSSASEWGSWSSVTFGVRKYGDQQLGLDPGDEYTFEVRAVNDIVKGATATVKATPWPTRPAVTADAQRQAVRLSWPWPGYGEVQAITSYEYRQRKGSAGTWGAWTAAGSAGFKDGYTVTSLTGDGSEYQFQVRSKIGDDAGPASEIVSAKPYGGSGAVPSPPTGLMVEAGQNRALISWTAGGDGVGGYCPTAGYYVRVYENSQEFPVVAESLRIDSGTSWYVEELNRNTYYVAEVWGEAEDGCWAETDPLQHTFWMPQGGAAPEEPSARAKLAPFPVSNLRVEYTSTPGQVNIRWDKPKKIGNKRAKRCAYVPEGGDQNSKYTLAEIEYSYIVWKDGYPADTDYVDATHTTDANTTTVTVSGLPTGTGHRLHVQVEAYSEECGEYSKSRHHAWWSQ